MQTAALENSGIQQWMKEDVTNLLVIMTTGFSKQNTRLLIKKMLCICPYTKKTHTNTHSILNRNKNLTVLFAGSLLSKSDRSRQRLESTKQKWLWTAHCISFVRNSLYASLLLPLSLWESSLWQILLRSIVRIQRSVSEHVHLWTIKCVFMNSKAWPWTC